MNGVTYPGTTGARLALTLDYQYGHLWKVRNYSSGLVYWQANTADARGNITQEVLGNTVITNRAFNAATGLLQSIQSGVGGGSALQNLAYQFDAMGNLKQRQDVNQSLTEGFDYDNLYRLKETKLNGTITGTATYYANGNINTRNDVGTYSYTSVRPHAVSSVTPITGPNWVYVYDANGNVTSKNGATVTWYADNKLQSISQTGASSSFEYTADGAYWKQNGSSPSGSENTTYIGGLLEVVTRNGTTVFRHQIKANGRTVAIISRDSGGADTASYLLADHLGSVDTVTNAAGGVVVRESFDAWGKRRNPLTWSGPITTGDENLIANNTRRGFTGHTELDNVGLVHMNGRVYDPTIGRFLSADPNIDGALNTQGWNRYTYVGNNPLSYTDPSGYFSFGRIFRSIVAIAVGIYFPPLMTQFIGAVAASSAAAATIAAGGGLLSAGISAVAAYGAAATATGTLLASAVVGGAIAGAVATGSLRGAAVGAVSAGLFFAAGTVAQGAGRGVHAAAHAGAGCLSSIAGGGSCRNGAISGGIADYAGNFVSTGSRFGDGVGYGLVGGAAAAASGGGFWDGFQNGVFGYAFNKCMHEGCWVTDEERRLAASGDYAGFYRLSCSNGDLYACRALEVATTKGFMAWETNMNLAGNIMWNTGVPIDYVSEVMEMVRMRLAGAYVQYLDSIGASESRPQFPTRQGIANFHYDVFRSVGAGHVFGGAIWDSIPGSRRVYDWCKVCR